MTTTPPRAQEAPRRPAPAVVVATPVSRLLLAATFLLASTTGVVFPLLADLQDEHGFATWGLGAIAAANFVTSVLTQLSLASLADRGRARLLLLGGLVLGAAGLTLFALAHELWTFVAARALTGASLGCFLPAARAIVAVGGGATPGRALGRLASVELLGFVFGPIVGALLASQFGLDTPFVVMAVAAVVGVGVLSRQRLPELAPVERRHGGAKPPPSITLLADRGVLAVSVVALALFFPVGIYESLWARYLEDRGASTVFTGVTIALYGVPFAALAGAGGRLADRMGPFRAAALALIAIGPLTALYGQFPWPGLIVSIAFVEAAFQAVAAPGAQAAMARACPPDRIAAGQGLAGAMGQLGAAGAALAGAPLYAAVGPEWLFVGVGATLFVLAVVALAMAPPRFRSQPAAVAS